MILVDGRMSLTNIIINSSSDTTGVLHLYLNNFIILFEILVQHPIHIIQSQDISP